MVWSGNVPTVRAFAVPEGGLVLGRDLVGECADDRMSRQHARITRAGAGFRLEELHSRNGTFLAGTQIGGEVDLFSRWVVRTARTVWIAFDDIRPFESGEVTVLDEIVRGARTTQLISDLEKATRLDSHVVLAGEAGSGRGHLARAYARWRNRPADTKIIEDVPGLTQEEGRELLAQLEATSQLRVAMSINTAARPIYPPLEEFLRRTAVWLDVPALRDRPDELARIVDDVVRGVNPELRCHASLIEQCMLGPRQLGLLISELQAAAHAALLDGKIVRDAHLATAKTAAWCVFPPARRDDPALN
jgi:hypothetical protein